jgi:ribosomal protein L21E
MVPAETIAVVGDLIATAFQGGVMHQRFIGSTKRIVTSRFTYGVQVLTLQWEKRLAIGLSRTI